jgi:hypothetical protein
MRTYLKTTEDASIYQRTPFTNSGLDEVLEVGKFIKPTDQKVAFESGSVRALLSFDVSTESPYPSNAQYYLNLYVASAQFINRYQRIEIYPISSSWTEGSGYAYQDRANASDGVTWYSSSRDTTWGVEGGDFVITPSASYTFSEIPISSNLRINVTNIIAPIVSGTNVIPWNGMVVKFSDVDETSQLSAGNIKFFSGNTHTVFEPTLEVVWSSQVFTTGSLKPIPNANVSIVAKNLKEAYTQGEVDKIYLVIRDPYPDKKFDATKRYRNQYYLPSSSYFRLRDQAADIILHRFDEYSTINCDASGSYILLDTNGLNVNRYYSLDIKVQNNDLVFFPEFNYTFKVDNDE